MRKKIVAGNWKMFLSLSQTQQLLNDLSKYELPLVSSNVTIVVFPAAMHLSLAQHYLKNSIIQYGGQNSYPVDYGAFTGEHSAIMYKDYGCSFMLVGHSERRQLFAENELFIAEKFHKIKDHDMMPVLCIGETLEERLQDKTYTVLSEQLQRIYSSYYDKNCYRNTIIAYEPVWAIGTGQTPLFAQIQEAHSFIRKQIALIDIDIASSLSIIYGGSVNEHNAKALFTMPDVDGVLIGGASLNAHKFMEIVKCIN